jgi:hypothetical protein
MVEYALLLAAIALTVVLDIRSMGQSTKTAVSSTRTQFQPGSFIKAGGSTSISPPNAP